MAFASLDAEDVKKRLLENPDDDRYLRKIGVSLHEFENPEDRKFFAVVYTLGCRFNGLKAEADRTEAHIFKNHKEFYATRFLQPEYVHEACEECRQEGVMRPACRQCEGTGKCRFCMGRGEIVPPEGAPLRNSYKCRRCKASGQCEFCSGTGLGRSRCPVCKGAGTLPSSERCRKVYTFLLTGDGSGISKWHPLRLDARTIIHAEDRYRLFKLRDEVIDRLKMASAEKAKGVLEELEKERQKVSDLLESDESVEATVRNTALLAGLTDLRNQISPIVKSYAEYEKQADRMIHKARITIRELKKASREPGAEYSLELNAVKAARAELNQLLYQLVGTRAADAVSKQLFGAERAIRVAEEAAGN